MALVPKIAIVGAGPAGLTLARLLHVSQHKIDVTVYEIDVSPDSRPEQGGTLDLGADGGQAALRRCELWDAFEKYARFEGAELILSDKNWTELMHLKSGQRDRPEIDRYRLREILLESLPKEIVRWGWKVKEVGENGMLKFEGREDKDGPFDLIVGADGAWSKVRSILTSIQPIYAGVSGYELEIKEPSKTCPELNKMVGRGGFFGSSDRKCLNTQRMGNDSLKVRSWYICAEGEAKADLDKLGKKGTLEKVERRYDGWAPEMIQFLKQADLESMRIWTLYELPVGSKWEHKKGCTLIGDAASLATPFSGEGVNKAMKDSLELAELIERSLESNENLTLDQAVMCYEQLMFPRAEKLQATTMTYKNIVFGPEAPIGIFTGTIKHATRNSPSIWMKPLGSTPVLAFVYSLIWIRQQIGLAVRRYWRRN